MREGFNIFHPASRADCAEPGARLVVLPMKAPFLRIGAERPASPVILSVPHAGRDYRPELLRMARVPLYTLEALEDRLVDRLVWRATAAGATTFVAQVPRAEIDLNRDEREIDPALVHPPPAAGSFISSGRSRGGIGLIPSRIGGIGTIWNERISRTELERRIAEVHRPWHEAIEYALAEARERFGAAVLLDCHSMPPRGSSPPGSAGFVVFGDRHGTACAPALVEAAVAAAGAAGYRVARNAPYAGGYIAGRHGHPARGVHALQLELDRSAYLDAELRSPGPGFDMACRMIADIVTALEERLLGTDLAIAAE